MTNELTLKICGRQQYNILGSRHCSVWFQLDQYLPSLGAPLVALRQQPLKGPLRGFPTTT